MLKKNVCDFLHNFQLKVSWKIAYLLLEWPEFTWIGPHCRWV